MRDGVSALSLGGWPVGTSAEGCFICATGRDFRAAYKNLAGRMREQGRRCRAFKTTAREFLSGQRHLDCAEAARRFEDLERQPLLAAVEDDRR